MDKPAGPTSHDVVARVRRALKLKAVGHSGTLDPFATGLLVLLIGRATRLARFVEQQPKTYLASARLGTQTSTDDLTGSEIDGSTVRRFDNASEVPSRRVVEEALATFRGPQRQRPPAYSAKKVAGERSYRLARRGEAVELAEVDVTVYAVELVDYQYPMVIFRATVSPGTYLRALGRDLGERLGTGAHLTALRREAIGSLRVEDAVALERVGSETKVLPPLAVLGHLPQLEVTAADSGALGFGRSIHPGVGGSERSGSGDSGPIALVHQGTLVAIAEREDANLRPVVVLEPAG